MDKRIYFDNSNNIEVVVLQFYVTPVIIYQRDLQENFTNEEKLVLQLGTYWDGKIGHIYEVSLRDFLSTRFKEVLP